MSEEQGDISQLFECISAKLSTGPNEQLGFSLTAKQQRHCYDTMRLARHNIPAAKSPSPVVLPDELTEEILSFLPVKTLVRFKCVSKSWNTLVSDPTFVKMHLRRSARKPCLTLMGPEHRECCNVQPIPVCLLLENSRSITVPHYCCDPFFDCFWLIGSCNGLLCLLGYSDGDYWLCFWNPATRRSEKLGHFRDFGRGFKFSFGYDNSTGTYKVVAFHMKEGVIGDEASWRSEVRVFSSRDNCWRSIQSFPPPLVPINFSEFYFTRFAVQNDGTHFSGTINWLALRNYFMYGYYSDFKEITDEQLVIVSLDLSSETYTLLLPPQGFDEAPSCCLPALGVFMGCLCFTHNFPKSHFVIWQMKQFGVQESWTQLLKISYQNILNRDYKFHECQMSLLYLSENLDTLILSNDEEDGRAIIYNSIDNRVKRSRTTRKIAWFWSKDYVESLVWTH